MSRRILHIIDSLGRTGTANQLLVLAQGLLHQGWDVHVAALDGGGSRLAEFEATGVHSTELGRRWAVDPIIYGRLHRVVSRLRPEIIHTWSTAAGTYGRIVAGIAKTSRLICGKSRIEPRTWGTLSGRWLAHRTEKCITSSEYARDWYIQRGWPAEKLVVIKPGVPPAQTSNVSRDDLCRELQLPTSARLIGVVGRLVPEKRVKDLIWAADLLRVLHDNLRLLVIGDGLLRPQLEQYSRLASDLDHIRFLGERADTWRIMPHLDVLWNASENRGPSIAILEAMAAGVPVIASDTPFNREFVVEGETAYLIPLNNRAGRATRARHTDRIFTDHELAARLSSASCQRVAEFFSADRMVRQYVDMYRAAIG